MEKLYYCLECKRIFHAENGCTYCNSKSIKELAQNAPVNVIGSKLKGRVLKTGQGKVSVLFVDESKNRSIKEYDTSSIRKIL